MISGSALLGMASNLCKNCAVAADIRLAGTTQRGTTNDAVDCLNELLYEIETNPERKSRITIFKSIDVQTGFQKTDESRTVVGTTFDKACTKQAEFFASLPWPWSVTAFLGGGGVTCRGWKVVVGIAGIAGLLVRLELVRLVGGEERNPNLSP